MAKVRVIATNEILDFAPDSFVAVHRPGSYEDIEYPICEIEIIPDEDNSCRNLFAAALRTLLERGNNSDEWIAKRAFDIADAMIKQMGK